MIKTEEDLGTPATEMRELLGRVGEIYAAIKTDGKLTGHTNKKSYDVIQGNGRTLSVKTAGTMQDIVDINKKRLILLMTQW